MPYTSPGRRSQSVQGIHLDGPAESDSAGSEVSSTTGQPSSPRDYSSMSYARRHRRSPSVTQTVALPIEESAAYGIMVHGEDPPSPLTNDVHTMRRSPSSSESDTEAGLTDSSNASPDDSEREESDPPPRRSPLLRKKSGELVRPALRRPFSAPGTPTLPKFVHFSTQLAQIKHFLQVDMPLAVSADTSPVEEWLDNADFPFDEEHEQPEFDWEMRLTNFPKDPASRPRGAVVLERMYLSADQQNLIGVVAVANLAYQKHVAARFTFDHWKTVSEVSAEYNEDASKKFPYDGYDRFNFAINLSDRANLESKKLFICVRYNVRGEEYWDNNSMMNYEVVFARKEKADIPEKSEDRHPSASLLPHAHPEPPPSNKARPVPPPSDGFSFNPGRSHTALDTDESVFELNKADSRDPEAEPFKPREKQARQGFGTRYDFHLSLSAAMQSRDTTQDRTALVTRAKADGQSGSHGVSQSEGSSPVLDAKDSFFNPSTIVSTKHDLGSPVYKELVDKYCFVSA